MFPIIICVAMWRRLMVQRRQNREERLWVIQRWATETDMGESECSESMRERKEKKGRHRAKEGGKEMERI